MKCKHCSGEMVLDNGKILTGYPLKLVYTCPRCGDIEIEYVTTTVPFDLGSGMIIVAGNNLYPATSKLEIRTPSDEEMRIRAD